MNGLLIALSLLGAAANPPIEGPRTELVDPAAVMHVPAELTAQFRAAVIAPGGTQLQRMNRMAEWMFAPDGLGIQYRHDATYTVAEAWQRREANCLTFTLLTVALAREGGFEAYGQYLDDTLMWRQQSSTLYRTEHVNAGLIADNHRYTIDVASDEVISHAPPQRIDDRRLLAQFYNNRAAELAERGLFDAALAHARSGLRMDAEYAVSWNNLGVLEVRVGRIADAERSYLQALARDPKQPSALTNLSALYERQGQPERAQPYQRRLETVLRGNPFHHFLLALDAERKGSLKEAAKLFRRAIHLYPNEHRFHFGLARVYFQQHKPESAGKALERARQLSAGDDRLRYQAKLEKLRRPG